MGRPEEEGEEEVVLIIMMIMRIMIIMIIMIITMIMMIMRIMMIKRMIFIMVWEGMPTFSDEGLRDGHFHVGDSVELYSRTQF